MQQLHAEEDQRRRNREYYNENSEKVKKRVKKRYKQNRKKVAEELGGECVFCGETNLDLLNFHHTIPMTLKCSKIYHYLNNLDILCLLCVKCHVTYHNVMDWLYIDDIFKEEGEEFNYERYKRLY